ncbi:acyl transferase/acyl hydrolase/lysophospholipase, partial [Pyronema domesticum]
GHCIQEYGRLLKERQNIKNEQRCLFSLTHFKAFFNAACNHWVKNPTTSFDFIRATRLANPVSPRFPEHINKIFSLVKPEIAISLATSSLVLDSVPPGMYVFEPYAVFQSLYRQICESAGIKNPTLQDLKHTFTTFILQMERENLTAAEFHIKTLQAHRLGYIYSRSTCLCCLSRYPERGLPCGHTICEKCIQIFGQKSNPYGHIFRISRCPLCGDSREVTAHIKPPTAGVRLLSIDGGGIRGVLPLQALRSLETTFNYLTGTSGPIQEHFDLAIGTSSGGLIVFGLFINGWSVGECANQFVRLAEKAFSKPRNLLISIFTSRYSAGGMDEALKEAFGDEKSLIDWSHASFPTKVAVTATTTDTPSACIFGNYIVEGFQPPDCGYSLVILPDDQNIRVWEAARCTSAAPSYFPPQALQDHNIGTFQDGGLLNNNPLGIAQREMRVIWPQPTVMDIALSLGTGTASFSASGINWWSRSWLGRVYQSFMTSLDGQRAWEELQNHLPEERKARYFRLNHQFEGQEPPIDDLAEMHRLNTPAKEGATTTTDMEFAELLVTKQFYFELDETPRYIDNRYQCTGYLRCRFQGPKQVKLLNHILKIGGGGGGPSSVLVVVLASWCSGMNP